jgi:transcription elongation factor Elf1
MRLPPPKWPQIWICGKCGEETLEVYPRPNEPKGWAICKNCTPNFEFNQDFARKASKGYPGFEE